MSDKDKDKDKDKVVRLRKIGDPPGTSSVRLQQSTPAPTPQSGGIARTPTAPSGGGGGIARTPTTSTSSTQLPNRGPSPSINIARTGLAPSMPTGGAKKFMPNTNQVRKKYDEQPKPNADLFSGGAISDIILDSLNPIGRPDQKRTDPKRPGRINSAINPNRNNRRPQSALPNLPSLPLTDLPESLLQRNEQQRANKEADKLNEAFVNQLFHEMEIDPNQPSHPTHLPLVDPRKIMKEYSLKDAKLDLEKKKKELQAQIENGELSDQRDLGEDGGKKKEDERIKPFYNEGIFLNEDNLFFIQLPTSLPSTASRPVPSMIMTPPPPVAKAPPKPPAKPAKAGAKQAAKDKEDEDDQPKVILTEKSFVPMVYPGDFPNTLKYMNSGQLGTLKFYKSGKVVMSVGPVDYEISAGNKLKFLEEVQCITHEGPTCYTLGTPDQHLVAAPMLNQIK
ncbi:RNA polymerase III subunit [Cavenderia fasciculata]|uniref:RNA polymerase III subunit n=1 Tax=Cavenderia fasciculata TaxID=261658 RepID=F4QD15_CACFS|nr:RNA polymerase III subunit [Cavenderia fasciculata]EGG13696.1 RNA polymerase III subunit [Cavenderia fasciculata]|eukprot:XP_004350400.1 RNA polymerase III subunit [Cavenderia fasciculata]